MRIQSKTVSEVAKPVMDLHDIRNVIAKHIPKLGYESVRLTASIFRVLAEQHAAAIPQPEFCQSTRDGFVVPKTPAGSTTEGRFQITSEIPAGSTREITLASGMACRIMTGGMLPSGGVRVVPQEDCVAQDGSIRVPAEVLQRKNTFIQHEGSEIRQGEMVVPAGAVLLPEYVALLAAVGHERVPVYPKPRVGFFCTGSELVESPGDMQRGLKISSNRYLLDALVHQFGAEVEYLGTVADTPESLQAIFHQLDLAKYDLLISTGGMGGGKYDLLQGAFAQAGGRVVFSGLNMRPGKSTLFGTIGKTLFFGLPGPPTAVRALMNAFVGPALLQMQGVRETYPRTVQAFLKHFVRVKQQGVLHLKSGVVSVELGICKVRLADNQEPPSCYLVLPPERCEFAEGDLINVHLTSSPLGDGGL